MEKEIIKKEGQELEVWGSRDPKEVVKKAEEIANIISNKILEKKLYTEIQGKNYVHCEGWTMAGALLGLFPRISEVREERSQRGVKFIATCEIITSDGRIVSRGVSECASWERNKKYQEEYAIRSMAETRAVSKAFRLLLSWIMAFSGFEPTPAEEVEEQQEEVKKWTTEELKKYYIILGKIGINKEEAKNLIEALYQKRSLKELTEEQLEELFDLIKEFKTKQDFDNFIKTLKGGEKDE